MMDDVKTNFVGTIHKENDKNMSERNSQQGEEKSEGGVAHIVQLGRVILAEDNKQGMW